MNIFKKIVELMPVAVSWIRARLEAGETPEAIRRDINTRTAEVIANRKARDDQFEAKFGRKMGDD